MFVFRLKMDHILGSDLTSTHNSGCRNKNEDAHFFNWARGRMISTQKQSLVQSDCNSVSSSAAQKVHLSKVQLLLHASHHEREHWNPSFPEQGKVRRKHTLLTCQLEPSAPSMFWEIDVMAFYGIHFHWTSTWFDIVGRGEKMCRDQQKLKLEPVFLCHYFCDLDKTSTFDKAQYWQLLVTSTVSLHLKGTAARKSPSKQTEKHSSASVWHMPVKAPGTNRYFCTNKNWAHYCNTAIFQSCLFRCKKAE